MLTLPDYFVSPRAYKRFRAMLPVRPRVPGEDDPHVQALIAKLRKQFREQHQAVLAGMGRAKAPSGPSTLPSRFVPLDQWIDWTFLESRPLIEMWMNQASGRFLARVGASPDTWAVVSPKLREAVDSLTLAFCKETNQTTSQNLQDALDNLREEMDAGLFQGDPVPELTRRVNAIFDLAETWRAKRIAVTEASRSVHRAERIAGKESGVVKGWRWLASSDACDDCRDLHGKTVGPDEPFTTIDAKRPEYRKIFHPPLHPHDQCTAEAVIDEAALAPGVSMSDLLAERRRLGGKGYARA